jgi:hypothetical protein
MLEHFTMRNVNKILYCFTYHSVFAYEHHRMGEDSKKFISYMQAYTPCDKLRMLFSSHIPDTQQLAIRLELSDG